MSEKRLSGWKIAGIVVGILAVLGVALIFWVAGVAGRKFSDMERRLVILGGVAQNRDFSRPVLYGSAVPGNAWRDYGLAEAEIRKFKDADKLGAIVDGNPKADPAIGEAALEQHAAVLDHLRRGAGASKSRYLYSWGQGSEMKTPGLSQSIQICGLAILASRKQTGQAAAETLLDVCQFSRDLADDGPLLMEMMGMAGLGVGLTEIHARLLARTLDREALETLERGLEILERSFPSHDQTLLREGMLFGTTMLKHSDSNFLGRLLAADCAESRLILQGRAAAASRLSWAEEETELKAIQAGVSSSWNPLTRVSGASMALTSRINRERRAHLRLLRAGLRYAASGEILDLEDPFGARLKTQKSGDTLKLWSLGRDGVDDGGDGAWPGKGKDLVLEVPR